MMTLTARLSLPSQPAPIHRVDVSLPKRELRRHVGAARARALGITLAVGAAALAIAGATMSPATPFVIPITWAIGTALAGVSGALAARSIDPLDDKSMARSRAALFFGLALLGPLTLHALAQPNLWAPSPYLSLVDRDQSFTAWVHSSLILTGIPHLVFAALCAWRGRAGRLRGPRLVVIGVVAAASAAFDVLLYSLFGLLPVLYVGVTSVPLLWMMRQLERRLTTP